MTDVNAKGTTLPRFSLLALFLLTLVVAVLATILLHAPPVMLLFILVPAVCGLLATPFLLLRAIVLLGSRRDEDELDRCVAVLLVCAAPAMTLATVWLLSGGLIP